MATLNIRLDDKLKSDALAVLEKQGVSPSDFIRGVFQYVAEQQRLPIQTTSFTPENLEATTALWSAFKKVRNSGAVIVELFRQDKNIALEALTKFYKSIDQFHQSSNSVITRLVKAREWTQIDLELQKLSYQLKYQGLSSRLGPEYVMYSTDAINEFSKSFHALEYLAHELMLNSRYL